MIRLILSPIYFHCILWGPSDLESAAIKPVTDCHVNKSSRFGIFQKEVFFLVLLKLTWNRNFFQLSSSRSLFSPIVHRLLLGSEDRSILRSNSRYIVVLLRVMFVSSPLRLV